MTENQIKPKNIINKSHTKQTKLQQKAKKEKTV